MWERKRSSFQLLPEFSEMDMANCWHFAGELLTSLLFCTACGKCDFVQKVLFSPPSLVHVFMPIHCSTSTTTCYELELFTRVPKTMSGTDWICFAGALSAERCKLAFHLKCTILCLCVRAK